MNGMCSMGLLLLKSKSGFAVVLNGMACRNHGRPPATLPAAGQSSIHEMAAERSRGGGNETLIVLGEGPRPYLFILFFSGGSSMF